MASGNVKPFVIVVLSLFIDHLLSDVAGGIVAQQCSAKVGACDSLRFPFNLFSIGIY